MDLVDAPDRHVPCDAPVATRKAGALRQLLSFGIVGVASTAFALTVYAVLRTWWPPLAANLVSLVVTTLLNTEANRRLTFAGARGGSARVHLQALAVFVLYYAITSGALLVLDAAVRHPPRALEVAVLLAASALGTVGRFLVLRAWVFKP